MYEESDTIYASMRNLLIVLVCLGVIAGFLLGFFLSRSISKPLESVVKMIQELSKGHLGMRLKLNREDEIGIMASSMDEFADDLQNNVVATMQKIANGDTTNDIHVKDSQDEISIAIKKLTENLRGLIADMNTMSEQHNAGDIDVVIPADKFKGAYKIMAQGVNEMVMGHIGVKKKAMACISEFSNGNFEAPLEKFPGKKAFINDTIEGLRANLKKFSEELVILVKAASEGELDKRANADAFVGDWKLLASGVNDTVTNIVNPLMVTADYVDKISKGVIPPEITTTYKGQYNIIKVNLNAVVKMMNELLSETDAVIKAAADGELDKRADAEKFLGGWNKLVLGVNDTITNIVNPLMVTADYVEKISNGVIPPEITATYKGQYNIIKNNLNSVVKMMSELLNETDAVIKAAADGELDKRADAGKFLGGWNKLVLGVNDTITNIVNPLMVTADYVEKISKGIIPPAITTIYKGQYNTIKTNLNQCIEALNDLIVEDGGNVLIGGCQQGSY